MSDEDEDMNWFADHDPFSMLGHVRIIVVRHTPEFNFRGELDNCTYIAATDGLYLGFACNPIDKKYNLNYVLPTYADDVENCAHKINHIFKSKPNGIYELVGEMWAWSSQSYEGEWDGDTEVRNYKIQQVRFKDAIAHCEIGEGLYNELVRLRIDKKNEEWEQVYSDSTDIHPYMPKKTIMAHHANALSQIIEGTYHNRTNFEDSSIEELEACIHMMMLQIDSEKRLETYREWALAVDHKVKDVLNAHEHQMATES